jgi:hypothetical protein
VILTRTYSDLTEEVYSDWEEYPYGHWTWPRESESDWPEEVWQKLLEELVIHQKQHREHAVRANELTCPWQHGQLVEPKISCQTCEKFYGDRKHGYRLFVRVGTFEAQWPAPKRKFG